MDERVLLMSGFYGVRLPDGRRLLEKPPAGVLLEGPNPGPFGLAVGSSPVFRLVNLNDREYALQYSPNQGAIVLEYIDALNAATIPSFEGEYHGDYGISAAGVNRRAFPSLFNPPPRPGYDNLSIPENLREYQQTIADLYRQRAAAGVTVDIVSPFDLAIVSGQTPTNIYTAPAPQNQPVAPPAYSPVAPPTPAPGIVAPQSGSGSAAPAPSTDVYYMQSTPGGAVVHTTRNEATPMPAGISPVAVAGAMVLLFLLGDDERK